MLRIQIAYIAAMMESSTIIFGPVPIRLCQTFHPLDCSSALLLNTSERHGIAKEGITAQDLRSLWIDDMVDSWWAFEGDEKVEWVRLIPEDEKTEDFKREEERIAMMAIDRESREIRMHEEYEKEQLRKQKRKARTKKTSSSQSL